MSIPALGQSFSASDTNRDASGKVQRGSYLTNPWYDNWNIGVAVGVQALVSGTKDYNKGVDLGTVRPTPMFDGTITKWFAPAIALRFGLQGLSLQENWANDRNNVWNHYPPMNVDNVNYYGLTYMHVDAVWNIVNTIWGYKYNRLITLSPYLHAGYLRLTMPKEYPSGVPSANPDGLFTRLYRDREIGMGFGLLTSIRLDDHFNAHIDIKDINISGRYHDADNGGRVNIPSVSFGLSYSLHKWYWNRSVVIEQDRDAAIASSVATQAALAQAEAARRALEDQNVALTEQNAALADLNDTLKNQNEELSDASQRLAEQLNIPYDELREVAKSELKKAPDDILLQRASKADVIIYYDINVDKASPTELLRLANYVKLTEDRDPGHVYYITGSADKGTGNVTINTRLSKGRADNIRRILIREFGIPSSRVVVKGNIISDKHKDGRLDRCVLMENE